VADVRPTRTIHSNADTMIAPSAIGERLRPVVAGLAGLLLEVTCGGQRRSAATAAGWALPEGMGYIVNMTQTLDAAIAKLAALPPEEQDRVGRWLLDELRDEERWAQQFGGSREALGKLAAEARADRTAGRATDLDPEKL